jgi:hypothetical protein
MRLITVESTPPEARITNDILEISFKHANNNPESEIEFSWAKAQLFDMPDQNGLSSFVAGEHANLQSIYGQKHPFHIAENMDIQDRESAFKADIPQEHARLLWTNACDVFDKVLPRFRGASKRAEQVFEFISFGIQIGVCFRNSVCALTWKRVPARF